MRSHTHLLAFITLLPLAFARPAPVDQVAERDLLSTVGGVVATLTDAVSTVTSVVGSVVTGPAALTSVLNSLETITPTAVITDVQQASSALSSAILASPTPTDIYGTIANLVAAGLTTDNVETIANFIGNYSEGPGQGPGNWNNSNPDPPRSIYPQADPLDVVYDLSESDLRGAIYIPDSFQYGCGDVDPIILVPGTGSTGYTTYIGNYIPLLQGSNIADPVWLNIPIFLLSDAQNNAEFVAYAINYISAISQDRPVTVLTWSQGGLDAQWAFKFWPSTRFITTDLVAYSSDYHGTLVANLAAAPGEPLPPALLQQEYNSKFVTALRGQNGDSAFVPTTNVYSGFFDEIVVPQQDPNASGSLFDVRGFGVTNNEVQIVCAGQTAGTFYTHEGVLYNPLGYYLLIDAIANDGPGQPGRLDLGSVCNNYLTPGLNLADVLLTENTIPHAVVAIITYPYPVFNEPNIKPQYNATYAAYISDV